MKNEAYDGQLSATQTFQERLMTHVTWKMRFWSMFTFD